MKLCNQDPDRASRQWPTAELRVHGVEMFNSQPKEQTFNSELAQAANISKSQAVIEFKLNGTIVTANKNFLGREYLAPPAVEHNLLRGRVSEPRILATPPDVWCRLAW